MLSPPGIALRVHVLDSLNASREVKITDFLTFTFKDVGDRVRRNPRTNEQVLKEPSRFPRVRFSAVFEGNVKQNGIPLIEQTVDEKPKRGRRKAKTDSPVPSTSIPVAEPVAKPQEPIPLGIAFVPPSPPEPEIIAEIAPPSPPVFVEQAPPPPPPEKHYRLTDQSLLPESQVRVFPPTTLIWHPDFGQSWKQVGEIFP
ncbi:MAG: HU family DNA-binding protein [Microcystaceae cyanobacterium]